MNRPRLFLSAVSEELRTARQAVAVTVRTLGFDPVSQDDFPTGYGELRQWLRTQLDSCKGFIQLVGDGYGAELPEVDTEYGRVSYSQLEFFYASHQNKKTWVIVIGKEFERDKPPDQLDLPRDAGHPDPANYQAERRTLQQDYIARLKRENHLRHTANNKDQLEIIVLHLRDELGELRQQWEEWLMKDKVSKDRTTASLAELVEAGRLTTEKIRAHLLQTAEETHRRELAEAEAGTDWKRRQQLRKAADNAHSVRLSRIEEMAVSFAEIEGRGTATNVFQEMIRILTEQAVDEAIAYVGTQRSSILQTVRARAATVRERNHADLQPLLQSAALYEAKGQHAEARALYTDILAVEPDWQEALHASFWFLDNQGDLARLRTTLADARRDYEEAHRIAQRFTAGDPGNTKWQRNLSVSYDRLGAVVVPQGRLVKAVRAYRKSLAITKTLVAGDPRNTEWQRDLSVSYNKLGDVAIAQEHFAKAAQAYGNGLAIRKLLAARDPSNTEWQRDLSVSYEKLGNVAVAEELLVKAVRAYRKSLAITKTLAAGDPRNTEWQRDLSVAHEKLGNVAVAQKQFTKAARAYGASLAIRKLLAARDPSNTEWQRDLSVSYEKFGNVAVAREQFSKAVRAYDDSVTVRKTLVARDACNTEWQRDLSESYRRLGDVTELQKNISGARTYWKHALDVLVGIDKQGLYLSPEDRQWLRKLRRKVGANTR
jgi:tetratricopeptide (TPR) repeat protein